MMSIRSLADNMELPGRCGDWLAPPPSPPRAYSSARHDERGGGDFYMATSGDLTWPPVGTFSWPRTPRGTRNDDFSPWSGADPGRRSAIQHDCDAAVLEQCPLSEMFNQAPRTNRQHRRVIAECGWPSSAPTPMADDTTRQPIRFGTVFSCVAVGEQEQT